MNNRITEEMMPALQGVIPATLASASADGVPNATYISQVYYADDEHVALSRQFFNKTIKNVLENPVVCAVITCPVTCHIFKLVLQFVESKTDGELFETMSLHLQALTGISAGSAEFNLISADIYKILKTERVYPF